MDTTMRKISAVLLMLAAMLVALYAVSLCLAAPGRETLLLGAPGDPDAEAAAFLDALCAGDLESAAAHALGELPAESAPAGEDASAVWAALRESLRWESCGECTVSGTLAKKAVRFRYLDVASLTEGLNDEVNALLARYVDEATRPEEIYNEDNSYKEEVVLRAWNAALGERLAAAGEYGTSVIMELELRYSEGAWKVVVSEALVRLLAGED